jgi:D-arabinose 1-dehydrogenase-like Zn-dependent alcohol dehydrogenase
MELIKKLELKISVTSFPLEDANAALAAIKKGFLEGSAVLTM